MAFTHLPVFAIGDENVYIDLQNTDPQLIAVVRPDLGAFHPICVVIENTDANEVITPPTINIGVFPPNYNSIVNSKVIALSVGNDEQTIFNAKVGALVVDESASIYLKVTIPSTGVEHLARVWVVGHYKAAEIL